MKNIWRPAAVVLTVSCVALAPVVEAPTNWWRPKAATPKTDVFSMAIAGVSQEELLRTPPLPEPHVHDSTEPTPVASRGANFGLGAQAELATEPTILTERLHTEPFDLVAVTWQGERAATDRVHVRVKEDGAWTGWYALEDSESHSPDPDSVEGRNSNAVSEPLMVANAEGVQVRIDASDTSLVQDPQVVLVSADQGLIDSSIGAGVISSAQAVGLPTVVGRSEWGADESKRKNDIETGTTLRAAFVHHTATTNNYSPEEAPSQVRALYRYFTDVRGYSDMGYNFVVDRFGRVYEGRLGSLSSPVVGAHTYGFNRETFAIAALGDFQKYRLQPGEAELMIESISSVLASRLASYNRDPQGLVTLMSSQPTNAPGAATNASVTTPVISGHRDVLKTACPGTHLAELLPLIRERAAAKLGAAIFDPIAEPNIFDFGAAGTTYRTRSNQPTTWNLQVINNCGAVVRSIAGGQAQAGPLDIAWDGRDGAGAPVPPGRYQMVLSGAGATGPFVSGSVLVQVNSVAGAPADPCPPPTAEVPVAFDLRGSGFGHGVGMSQYGALGQARAGATSAAILAHYYPGAVLTPAQVDVPIRVSLSNGSGSFALRGEPAQGDGGSLSISIDGNETVVGPNEIVRVRNAGGVVAVTRGGAAGTDAAVGQGSNVTVRWSGTRDPGSAGGAPGVVNATQATDATVATRLGSDGHRYRYGTLEITPTANGQVRVINTLALGDEYILGVAEMPSSWPAAALEAQAIASRSFAMAKYGRGRVDPACGCHVSATENDQVFAGWNKEKSAGGGAWRQAVMSTMTSNGGGSAGTGAPTGLILTHDGKPATAYFHSSSGGRTQDPAEVWGSSVGFTSVVDDPWSLDPAINPYANWTVSVAQQRVAQVFGLPAVSNLEVTARTASGAAKEIRATAPTGATAAITGSTARSAFGLRSTHLNAIGPSGATVSAVVQPGVTPVAGQPSGAITPAAPPLPGLALLSDAAPSVKVGAQVKFSGALSPAQSRVTVYRQRKIGKSWQIVGKARTNAKGEYKMAFKIPEKGNYIYRTVVLNKKKKLKLASNELVLSAGKKLAQKPAPTSCKKGGCDCPDCAGVSALPVAKS